MFFIIRLYLFRCKIFSIRCSEGPIVVVKPKTFSVGRKNFLISVKRSFFFKKKQIYLKLFFEFELANSLKFSKDYRNLLAVFLSCSLPYAPNIRKYFPTINILSQNKVSLLHMRALLSLLKGFLCRFQG